MTSAKNSNIFLDYKSPEWPEYIRELDEIRPIDTNAKAQKYREIWAKYHGEELPYPPTNSIS